MNEPPQTEPAKERPALTEREEFQELLFAFREYLGKRCDELEMALTADSLDTSDPYLNGFSRGAKTGLRIAEDLVFSYSEWVKRGIYYLGPEDLEQ